MSRIIDLTVTLKLELADRLERHEFYDNLESTLRSGLGEILAQSDDCVTVIAATDPEQVMSQMTHLTPALTPAREIAVVWSVEDVQEIRPDLTDEQAWQVLQFCERHHDAGDGINWHAIDFAAEHLFGPEPIDAEIAS